MKKTREPIGRALRKSEVRVIALPTRSGPKHAVEVQFLLEEHWQSPEPSTYAKLPAFLMEPDEAQNLGLLLLRAAEQADSASKDGAQ